MPEVPVATLECEGISKVFGDGPLQQTVLEDVSLSLHAGETCILLGPSGSGKTTLLSIFGCLLTPTAGEVRLRGESVRFGALEAMTSLRRRTIGFVFQHAQLFPFLSLEENLGAVGRNAGIDPAKLQERMAHLFSRLDIEELRRKSPGQASGGQQQRVAIARALVHSPAVVLADEPTAALDWNNGQKAVELLIDQAKIEGAALITVTHDTRLLPLFDRVIQIENGRIHET